MNARPGARRFYAAAAAVDGADGWTIGLDGRPARTPAGAPLRLPGRPLADAIAAEWQAQGKTIDPETMPLTRLAATALDRVACQRAEVAQAVGGYAATDLVCYRAAQPAELAALQHRVWQPLVDWAKARYAAALAVTEGVLPVPQPAVAVARLAAAVAAADDWTLTGLASAVPASGSLIIGLALMEARLDAEAAAAAALLDERYQAARWGVDAEAEGRRQRLAEDIAQARRFVDLAHGGGAAGEAGR